MQATHRPHPQESYRQMKSREESKMGGYKQHWGDLEKQEAGVYSEDVKNEVAPILRLEAWASMKTHPRQWGTATHGQCARLTVSVSLRELVTLWNSKDDQACVWSPLAILQDFCDVTWWHQGYDKISHALLNLKEMHLERYAKIINCVLSIHCQWHYGGTLAWKLTIMIHQELKVSMFWLSNRLYMMQIHDVRSDFTNIWVRVIWLINSNTA